jgi:hypothetical protein
VSVVNIVLAGTNFKPAFTEAREYILKPRRTCLDRAVFWRELLQVPVLPQHFVVRAVLSSIVFVDSTSS